MRAGRFVWPIALVGVALVVAAPTMGQEAQPERRKFSSLLNVDSLIDNYARFLVRKYNLNEEQAEFTNKLIHEKSKGFLGQHEARLRDLVDRMFEVRTGAEMSMDELMSWGHEIAPIYEEAKSIIIAGNNEWREILSPEQRAIHDQDLAQMQQSFGTTDDQLRRIVAGDMTVEEFRNPQRPGTPPPAGTKKAEAPPPPPDKVESSGKETPRTPAAPPVSPAGASETKGGKTPPPPPTPGKPVAQPENKGGKPVAPPVVNAPPSTPPQPAPVAPPPGSTAPPSGQRASANFASEWEQYTKQFIEKYKLNSEQTQKANDILKDCTEQGQSYWRSREKQVAELDRRTQALTASTDPNKSKELQTIAGERAKLLEALTKIFEKQLKPRLDRLPTRAQRKDAETPATKKPGVTAAAGKGASAAGSNPPTKGANPQPAPQPTPVQPTPAQPAGNPPVPPPAPPPPPPPAPEQPQTQPPADPGQPDKPEKKNDE